MTKKKTLLGLSESSDSSAVNDGLNGLFQDPYIKSNEFPKDRAKITIADLTALMQSVHELNTRAEELFNDKDYDGALPFLLESYERLTEFQFSPQSDEVTPVPEYMYWLAWVCYRIAFCYSEAEDYVKSYYYIDLVSCVNSLCFMEWINVLVNSRRMDALGLVESYLEDSEMLDRICKDDSDKKTVIDFLERRLGYLYIEYDELEKAREFFTRLLDNPDSCRFAQEELEYLDSIQGGDNC